MKIKKATYLIFLFFLLGLTSFSQESERVEASKFFAKSYFRLPIVTSNNFFTRSSRGISDIALSLNYDLYKGLNLGLGFKHSFFEISQFKITENLDAKTHLYGPYAEFSYIKYLSDKFFVDLSFQAGAYVISTSSNPTRSLGMDYKRSRGNYISPNLGIYLIGPDRICYSFTVGYAFTQTSITPETFSLESFKDFKQEDYIGNLQHINFGFGILVNIGKLDRVDIDE